MVKVLAVCANGDSQDNFNETIYIVSKLNLKDKAYEFTSVNMDDIKPGKTQLYNRHIVYKFGSDDKYKDNEEKYDIVIFQGCMSFIPSSVCNIFNEIYTFDTIMHVLDDDGMFIIVENCYYKGNVKDGAKIELSKNFVISDNIPRRYGSSKYDVWVKKKKNQYGMFLTYRSLDGF
jgi:hypothetical protein